MQIVAKEVKILRSREIVFFKVLWRNHQLEEATCEREEEMMINYPELFQVDGR